MRLGLALVLALALPGCAFPFVRPIADAPYYQDVLEGAPFTRLVVEIDYAPGHAPSDAATTHLMMSLHNVTRKTDITLDAQQTLADTSGKSWSDADLRALEQQTRRARHEAPQAVLHVLYPSGLYNGSVDVQGLTISGTSIGPVTVFLDAIRQIDAGKPLPTIPALPQQAELVERHTLLHEAGHAMGLVDNGLPMVRDHEDKTHPGHSASASSIMYWATDSVSATRQLLLRDGSVAETFDAEDLSDLKAGGGA